MATSAGFESNAFAFSVISFSNQTVVVEAQTTIAMAGWVPIQTNYLDNVETFSVTDPIAPGLRQRFYRVHTQ